MYNIISGSLMIVGTVWLLRTLLLILLENLGSIVLGDFMKNFHFNYKYVLGFLLVCFLSFLTYDIHRNNESLYTLARIELENQTRGGEDYISTNFKDFFNLTNCRTIFKDDEEVSKECKLLENKMNKTLDK